MGNTIKNYEKKKRQERKEAYKQFERIVYDSFMNRIVPLYGLKEKKSEMFDKLN